MSAPSPYIPGPPLRPPCGGWKDKLTGYSVPTDYRTADAAIPYWQNTTLVRDYEVDNFGVVAHPGGIPPYQAPNTNGIPLICSSVPDCVTDYPATNNNKPRCGPLQPHDVAPYDFLACPGTDSTHATVDNNCYVKTGSFVNLALCRKLGFKVVQALKWWQGDPGWLHRDNCSTTLGAACGDCTFTPYHAAAAPCHYLSQSQAINVVQTGDPTGSGSSITIGLLNLESGATVDRLSGNITFDGGSWSYTVWLAEGSGGPPGGGLVVEDAGTLYHDLTTGNGVGMSPDTWTNLAYRLFTATADCNGNLVIGAATDWETLVVGVINGTATDPTGGITGSRSVTDTTITGTVILNSAPAGPGVPTITTYTFTVTLGSPYYKDHATAVAAGNPTAPDVYSDAVNLAAQWDLTNDQVYPWRTDEQLTQGPQISRDEKQASPANAPYLWVSPPTDVINGTGAYVGLPNPAGYAQHFDRNHPNWGYCIDPDTSTRYDYILSYGEFTPGYLPRPATRWTPLIDAYVFKPTPGVYYSGNLLMLVKWAEVQVKRPSQNFARPCGNDRWSYEESSCRVVTADDGTTCTLANEGAATPLPTIGATDPWIFPDGLYLATRSGDYSIARNGAKIASLPANSITDTGVAGKARWPDAPSFGGRLAVAAAVQSGGNVIVTLPAPQYVLRTGDAVDFTSVAGLGSNLTITVTDSTHFTVAGTLSGTYTSGGFINIHGAANYEWFDDTSKGDYVYFEWQQNYRDFQEADRVCAQYLACSSCADAAVPGGITCVGGGSNIRTAQVSNGMPRQVTNFVQQQWCLEYNPCNPAVLCISPNGETWANGRTHGFPATIDPDDAYGYVWQAQIVQEVQDPLWETPHRRTVGDLHAQWLQDDGNCNADSDDAITPANSKHYYAHAPMVEARTALPLIGVDTAPAMPSGTYIGWLTLAQVIAGTPGIVAPPPVALGYALTAETPWGLFLREQGCVQSSGRFASQYEANGA